MDVGDGVGDGELGVRLGRRGRLSEVSVLRPEDLSLSLVGKLMRISPVQSSECKPSF